MTQLALVMCASSAEKPCEQEEDKKLQIVEVWLLTEMQWESLTQYEGTFLVNCRPAFFLSSANWHISYDKFGKRGSLLGLDKSGYKL